MGFQWAFAHCEQPVSRSSARCARPKTLRMGEPALVGRGPCHFQKPLDLMPALSSNAHEFGFFGGRQGDPLRRDAGPQDRDLSLEQPQLRVVSRHEELVQEDQKQGECRFNLAGLHQSLQKNAATST